MSNQKQSGKYKHNREKNYSASHPLYDLAKTICNPKGENTGHTAEYNGITFQLYMCRDTYYDEQGIPEREVTVTGLDEQEERWHVYRKDAAELAAERKRSAGNSNSIMLTMITKTVTFLGSFVATTMTVVN